VNLPEIRLPCGLNCTATSTATGKPPRLGKARKSINVTVHCWIERFVITGLIGAKRVADMERVLPNLRQKLIIDGAGHWVQQERPNEVNAALIAFLKANAPQFGLIEPASGQQFAGPADRSARKRKQTWIRRISTVIVIRDRARILQDRCCRIARWRRTSRTSH